MSEYYIGLMSGTSLDGIDAALVDFSEPPGRLKAFVYQPFNAAFKARLKAVVSAQAAVDLQELGRLDTLLGAQFAATVQALLSQAGVDKGQVNAIGSHGLTLYHHPDADCSFCLQMGDPNRIVEHCGITTVADFRRRDLAAGGQGAPLVPAFHQAIWGGAGETRAIVNIGGIANITVLPNDAATAVLGFDSGPGNGLLDAWIEELLDEAYDRDGQWAATGQVLPEVLAVLLDDAYFAKPMPKSTGKEYFNLDWLQGKVAINNYRPADIQATLLALTVESLSMALAASPNPPDRVIVCGGGAFNQWLMRKLSQRLAPLTVVSSTAYGIDPDCVEAMAFAWLARQTLQARPGNLPSVTGAAHPVVLGGIYPI
ncbi:MAG: anhydro-N-acetylmuramic acid kinase [Methylococcales bacterium]|nr:anhydro-N-acetylmuramic acid kinase [Methylococcales bacterium]